MHGFPLGGRAKCALNSTGVLRSRRAFGGGLVTCIWIYLDLCGSVNGYVYWLALRDLLLYISEVEVFSLSTNKKQHAILSKLLIMTVFFFMESVRQRCPHVTEAFF